MSDIVWIRMTTYGRGGDEVKYTWVSAATAADAELMEDMVTEWARYTPIGQCAESYRCDWVKVDALPARVVFNMRQDAVDSIAAAQRFAKALDGALEDMPTVSQCEIHDCQLPSTTRVHPVKDTPEVYTSDSVYEDFDVAACDQCAKTNESRAKGWERSRAIRKASQL